MKQPKKLGETIVFDSKYKKLIKKDYIVKDGITHEYIISSHGDKNRAGTMALALTKDLEVIYCKEFRYGTEEVIINFPVGMHEDNLSEVENMKKELEEEIGYNSDNIEYIGETIVGNYDDSKIKHFIAKDCYKIGKPKPEPGEYIEVCKSSIQDFDKMILDGKVKCPLTISCWVLCKGKLNLQ